MSFSGVADSELALLSLESAAELLRKRQISPVELMDAVLARVQRLNPHLNAFITVARESAQARAKLAEKEITTGNHRGPLHGIPVALKDNIVTEGIRTTAGSKFFSASENSPEATISKRLRRAGAIVIGKTNLHEFAYGVTTNNPHFGPTRNPWGLGCIPGGSSGGSAAALAAGMAFAAVGTDTGGSIRIPSALCGVIGLKPTYGRVSCFGVVPVARTLDHAGPMARTVADAAIMLKAIAGYDPLDPATVCKSVPDYRAALQGEIKGVILASPREYFFDHIDPEVREVVQHALHNLEDMGATIEEIRLLDFAETVAPSTHIAFAEATQYHQSAGFFPSRADDYGCDVRERLAAGMEVKATDYLRALEIRSAFSKRMDTLFEKIQAILVPAAPIPAPRIGEDTIVIDGVEETVRLALIRMNRPANLTGHPAISVPCGFTRAGLPVGLQMIGPRWDEGGLLRVAHAYEQATEWHNCSPPEITDPGP